MTALLRRLAHLQATRPFHFLVVTLVTVALAARAIHVDSRGDLLRVGPAPYTTDEEIDRAMETLGAWLR